MARSSPHSRALISCSWLAVMSEANNFYPWNNYDTWAVVYWIYREPSCEYWRERAQYWREQLAMPFHTQEESAWLNLADELQVFFEERNPLDDDESLYASLLRTALSKVHWDEIADHLLSED